MKFSGALPCSRCQCNRHSLRRFDPSSFQAWTCLSCPRGGLLGAAGRSGAEAWGGAAQGQTLEDRAMVPISVGRIKIAMALACLAAEDWARAG